MNEPLCARCGRSLGVYDIGAYKKLVNRGADAGFLCSPCLASHFSCSETRIREKIREFQQMGCTLFPPLDEA